MKKVVILLFFTIALFLFCESSLFAQNEIKNESHIYKIDGFIYILKNQSEELEQISYDLLMLHEKEEGKPFSSKNLTPIYLKEINNFLFSIKKDNFSIAKEILLIRNILLYERYLLSICPFVEKRWKNKVYQKK